MTSDLFFDAFLSFPLFEEETATGDIEYQTAVSLNPGTKQPALYSSNDQLRPFASSTQRKTTSKRSPNLERLPLARKEKLLPKGVLI